MDSKTRKKKLLPLTHGMMPSTGNEHITVIPGAPSTFISMKSAFATARTAGMTVGMFAFTQRVRKGLSWDEILKPARHIPAAETQDKIKAVRERKRAEMHDICATIDKRKAEIANG